MIKITNIDVGQGDCILLHLESEKRCFNLLIDGGCAGKKAYDKIKESLKKEELNGIVVTHSDADHIAGIIKLVKQNVIDTSRTFILFNKYDETMISYNQAKELADLINRNFNEGLLIKSYAKAYTEEDNERINGDKSKKDELYVNLLSFNQRKKTSILNNEKINITILWPDTASVKKFMRNWHDEKKVAQIINKASITILIEFSGHAVLMPGDAYFSDIIPRLEEVGINHIDVIKASHHGAKENNNGLIDTVKKYKCKEVMFTISGQSSDLHPDLDLIKKLAGTGCVLSCSAEIKCEKIKKSIVTKNEITIGDCL